MRAVIVTKEKYNGHQRKIAWFSRQEKDLYFDYFGSFLGSHTSYHRDGSIWRTSPVTQNKPKKIDHTIPLNDFEGWYQLGTGMINRDIISKNPELKEKDRKSDFYLEISLEKYTSKFLNIVIELVESSLYKFLETPPKDADIHILKFEKAWVIITLLGYDHNLIIRPLSNGFTVLHFNNRYSANIKGVNYSYEAYKV